MQLNDAQMMLDLIYVILWQSECEDADQAERAAIKFHLGKLWLEMTGPVQVMSRVMSDHGNALCHVSRCQHPSHRTVGWYRGDIYCKNDYQKNMEIFVLLESLSRPILIHKYVFARESRHLDNDDNLYCSVGVGCCQFLMLLIKHLMLQLPSTTQTRSMSTNQTIILLGMLQS